MASTREIAELLVERYGPTYGLIHEAVAKPPPPPSRRPIPAEDAAAHRRELVDAMQMGTGTYGTRRRDQRGRFRSGR